MPSGRPAQSAELSPVQIGLETSDQLADTLLNSVSFSCLYPTHISINLQTSLFFISSIVGLFYFPSETEVGNFDSRELPENVLPQVLDLAPACF